MRPLSPSASQNGSPLALETLGSCLAELAEGPYVKRLLAPCSNQIYHGFAPGSRCVPSVPSQPSSSSFEPLPALVHLTRTAPSPLHLTPASTPAAPRLTSNQPNPTQPTGNPAASFCCQNHRCPRCFGTGHGASDTPSGVVVSLDRFMCDAPNLPAPFEEFQPVYNNTRLPTTLATLKKV